MAFTHTYTDNSLFDYLWIVYLALLAVTLVLAVCLILEVLVEALNFFYHFLRSSKSPFWTLHGYTKQDEMNFEKKVKVCKLAVKDAETKIAQESISEQYMVKQEAIYEQPIAHQAPVEEAEDLTSARIFPNAQQEEAEDLTSARIFPNAQQEEAEDLTSARIFPYARQEEAEDLTSSRIFPNAQQEEAEDLTSSRIFPNAQQEEAEDLTSSRIFPNAQQEEAEDLTSSRIFYNAEPVVEQSSNESLASSSIEVSNVEEEVVVEEEKPDTWYLASTQSVRPSGPYHSSQINSLLDKLSPNLKISRSIKGPWKYLGDKFMLGVNPFDGSPVKQLAALAFKAKLMEEPEWACLFEEEEEINVRFIDESSMLKSCIKARSNIKSSKNVRMSTETIRTIPNTVQREPRLQEWITVGPAKHQVRCSFLKRIKWEVRLIPYVEGVAHAIPEYAENEHKVRWFRVPKKFWNAPTPAAKKVASLVDSIPLRPGFAEPSKPQPPKKTSSERANTQWWIFGKDVSFGPFTNEAMNDSLDTLSPFATVSKTGPQGPWCPLGSLFNNGVCPFDGSDFFKSPAKNFKALWMQAALEQEEERRKSALAASVQVCH